MELTPSKATQIATALLSASTATCAPPAVWPAGDTSTGACQTPPVGRTALCTTPPLVLERSQTATALPCGSTATSAPGAVWPAEDTSTGACQIPPVGRTALCTTPAVALERAPDRDRVALPIDSHVNGADARAVGGDVGGLPVPSRRAHRALHDAVREVRARPDRDRVALRINNDPWGAWAQALGSYEGDVDGRLPGPASRTHRALHGDRGAAGVDLIPDRNRVALRIDSDVRDLSGRSGGGDVHSRQPDPARGPCRTLHRVLHDAGNRVEPRPDRDGVALRINSDLRPAGERGLAGA